MSLRRAVMPVVLLLALAWSAAAQRQQNVVQTATLKVRLYFDNGRPVQQQLLVRLTDAMGNIVSDAYSDTQGRAEFNGLNPGDYRLKVSGLGAEDTTSSTFSIMRGEGLHYETVDVRSKAEGADAGSGAPGGTVSATDLNVPDKAKKEFDKGTTALGRNDLAEAKAHFEKAVQIYPQYAGAYNNLGVVAMKAGDRDAATAAFQQAIHINSHYSRAYINLVRILLPDRKYSEAESMLDLALVTEPLNAEALTLLANVQLQIGKYAEAAATATKVHSVPHEGFAIVHIVAAVADENRHMPEEAAAQYAAYLKEAPDGPAAPRARQALAALQQMKGP